MLCRRQELAAAAAGGSSSGGRGSWESQARKHGIAVFLATHPPPPKLNLRCKADSPIQISIKQWGSRGPPSPASSAAPTPSHKCGAAAPACGSPAPIHSPSRSSPGADWAGQGHIDPGNSLIGQRGWAPDKARPAPALAPLSRVTYLPENLVPHPPTCRPPLSAPPSAWPSPRPA